SPGGGRRAGARPPGGRLGGVLAGRPRRDHLRHRRGAAGAGRRAGDDGGAPAGGLGLPHRAPLPAGAARAGRHGHRDARDQAPLPAGDAGAQGDRLLTLVARASSSPSWSSTRSTSPSYLRIRLRVSRTSASSSSPASSTSRARAQSIVSDTDGFF